MAELAKLELVKTNDAGPSTAHAPKAISDNAVPSVAGNSIIRGAEAINAGADKYLPNLNLLEQTATAGFLKNEGIGTVVGGTVGADVGAGLGGIIGYGLTGIYGTASGVVADGAIAFGVAGAAAGAAIGAVAVGVGYLGYEILKQSYDHPDRAPDPALLS